MCEVMEKCKVEIKLNTQENQEILLNELNENEETCALMKQDVSENSTGYKLLIEWLRKKISKDSVNIES